MWLLKESIEDAVKEGWADEINGLQQKLTTCSDRLEQWGRTINRKFGEEINALNKEVESFRGLDDSDSVAKVKALTEKLVLCILKEDNYKKQRGKIHWL